VHRKLCNTILHFWFMEDAAILYIRTHYKELFMLIFNYHLYFKNVYESYYNSYILIHVASYLLKLSVCYFNAPLLKLRSNAIGDNSASHNIQHINILKCSGYLFVRTTSTNSYTKIITHNLAALIKIIWT
jgi:hypothetical protein